MSSRDNVPGRDPMIRRCDFCTTEYEAFRPSSRFCSSLCRKRNQRAPARPHGAPPLPAHEHAPAPTVLDGKLEESTLAELTEAGRAASALGLAALLLARRLDAADREPGT